MMRAARPASVAILAGWALACGGSQPTPPDVFHRLTAAEPAASDESLLPGVVEVDRLGASDVLRSRAMVLAEAERPDELRRSAYHFWVDAPPVLVQDALVDYLRRTGLAGRVVMPEDREDPRWIVSGRIRRFEQVRSGGLSRAHVAVDLSLRVRSERGLRVQGVYEVVRPASGPSAREGAEAVSAALGEIFEAFVADVRAAFP